MKLRSKEIPRMLPFVLQAVSDLKDVPGSTMRKILDQVHTAIDISDIKPKPRNITMQVKKALRHAVENGVLQHKAGKYRLSFDLNATPKDPTNLCNKCKRGKRRKMSRRRRKRSTHRGRRRRTFKYSPSLASDGSDRSYRSTTIEAMKSRSRRRRRRSLAKKTRVQFRKSATGRKGNRSGLRRVRRGTPMPKKSKEREPSEGRRSVTKELEKSLENAFSTNQTNEQRDNNPGGDSATIVELPPECCDNPECLCNLKQEPSEDMTYEDPSQRPYM